MITLPLAHIAWDLVFVHFLSSYCSVTVNMLFVTILA